MRGLGIEIVPTRAVVHCDRKLSCPCSAHATAFLFFSLGFARSQPKGVILGDFTGRGDRRTIANPSLLGKKTKGPCQISTQHHLQLARKRGLLSSQA